MKELIMKSLEKIRPILQNDGGDVELVGVSKDGIVTVRMQGACGNCPGAIMTIKGIIEERLKKEVPGVKEVIGV
ncbi:NifU family protein [Clostridium sp. C8-1-8]|jgi:Fe-S cluster biogenesis protein NfuA|uniref:NifU family protein n=1 Tax=Clostridium sp. C8-1-8 TaxID=2698831 RepID=UPI00136BC7E4|nr:NifU family protein [Clostridium sp. C8-1-8]